MSIIEEGEQKKVRMAYLSIVCSHAVNGVAALHSELIKTTLFKEFHALYPDKLRNKTNGVTPRRWIYCCNPKLTDLLNDTLGGVDNWLTCLTNLTGLVPYADNADFVSKFIAIKKANKQRLREWVKDRTGYDVPLDSMYDVQVKRIHEYKRQLMNIFSVIYRYLQIKNTPPNQRAAKFTPRVTMIGGKAAPGYYNAKAIIKLCNAVMDKVNNDKTIENYLKVIFLPNYNVSAAQVIIPATELS
jgi:starch phosphorylase